MTPKPTRKPKVVTVKAWAVVHKGGSFAEGTEKIYQWQMAKGDTNYSTLPAIFYTKREAEQWRKKWANGSDMHTLPVTLTYKI